MSHVQDMMIIEHLVSTNLSQKITFLLGIFLFIPKFQNHGNKHDHGLLWIKNAPMYEVHTNQEIK